MTEKVAAGPRRRRIRLDWSGSCRRHVQQRCSRQVTALNISIIMPKETFRHDQIQRTVLVKSRWCNLMHAVASSSVCHLQLAGSSRQRSRTAQHAQRWQTHRACMLGTRSEQAGCAAPSERRKSEIGSACSCAPGLGPMSMIFQRIGARASGRGRTWRTGTIS